MRTIKLQTDSILHVPLKKYYKDFIFIINSEIYETSSFFADLLSPIISSSHLIDPTFNEFKINTKFKGDFNKILNLIQFKEQEIDENDFSFLVEIFEQIGVEKVDINEHFETEITHDNVIDLIKFHQKHPQFYKKRIEKEIEFISLHFYELKEKILNEMNDEESKLEYNIIERIISNEQLRLESEDQLLEFINHLYLKSSKYSNLYEYVSFINVEVESMKKFIEIFDMNDLTRSSWSSLANRLQQTIIKDENGKHHEYIKKCFIEIETKENQFDGILNYLQTHSNIKEEINITASSVNDGDPFNLLQYDNKGNRYQTCDITNSWMCFEFKKHQIITSNYTIRSYNDNRHNHLKNWVFEGSTDNNNWIILDQQENNSFLNGSSLVHSFQISNKNLAQQSFKYLRIRQTGQNWINQNYLMMNSIEFYGKLI